MQVKKLIFGIYSRRGVYWNELVAMAWLKEKHSIYKGTRKLDIPFSLR